MAKRMLVDAAHPEETRVVVLNGHRLEEFDFETSTKKQIKGNIYLAKVTRVEPSLQAAFVEYGGNRHGFLAFGEIHPDYYRIPVADRRAALEAERVAEAVEDEIEERHVEAVSTVVSDTAAVEAAAKSLAENSLLDVIRGPEPDESAAAGEDATISSPGEPNYRAETAAGNAEPRSFDATPPEGDAFAEDDIIQSREPGQDDHAHEHDHGDDTQTFGAAHDHGHDDHDHDHHDHDHSHGEDGDHHVATSDLGTSDGIEPHPGFAEPAPSIETVGGDEIEETTRHRARPHRHYKIQEVIKRRQIMLVQVTKEERGNKGAALTTYISLAGRYCVLMPNTPRGGGVSRKITSMTDRRRLKDLMGDLEVPEGMGVIVRTAGSERSKVEIKRDFEYLMRLWDEIRDLTLKSTAPALIYEEGNLIKRSIRDLYSRDIDEVLVDGKEGYETAKSFMRMLMPSHTKRVKFYNDPSVPLFQRFQVEGQLDAIHSPVVQLRSGGYIVINPTEALVAIDVNSGRSTRERNIEETAFKTNLEASEEVARQLRLRDLAGLIVIDYIDMEEHRNNGAVERKLKEAMRHDRARIQLGRISPFGLLELSRQRLRPSLLEASTQPCPHCGGTGHIRSTESTALHVLRAIEEEGMRRRSAEITVAVPSSVALYILNQKRAALQQNEARYGFHVTVTEDDTLVPPAFRLDRVRAFTPAEIAALPVLEPLPMPVEEEPTEAEEEEDTALEDARDVASLPLADALYSEDEVESESWESSAEPSDQPREERGEGDSAAHGEGHAHGKRRRRRRRRGGSDRGRDAAAPAAIGAEPDQAAPFPVDEGFAAGDEGPSDELQAVHDGAIEEFAPGEAAGGENGERKRRRRGRRGGRRRRRAPGEAGPGENGLGEIAPGEAAHAEGDEGSAPEQLHEHFAYHLDEPVAPIVTSPTMAPATFSAPEPARIPDAPPPAPVTAAPVARQEPTPEPEPAEAERAPVAYNIPPAQEVVGPPPNPKRGWWRRR
jgi:ribonuclease E